MANNTRRIVLAILASLALFVTSNHLCFAQTSPANSTQIKQVQADTMEKLKKQIEKIGIGQKITVITLDQREFYGSISSIGAEDFQINEVNSKQSVSFKYNELKKVRKGYGGKNYAVGKRVKPGRGLLYGAAIFGTLFIILGIALSNDK